MTTFNSCWPMRKHTSRLLLHCGRNLSYFPSLKITSIFTKRKGFGMCRKPDSTVLRCKRMIKFVPHHHRNEVLWNYERGSKYMLSLSNSIQLNTVDLTVEILHSQNIRVCRNTAMQLMGRDHPTQIKESVNTSPSFFCSEVLSMGFRLQQRNWGPS